MKKLMIAFAAVVSAAVVQAASVTWTVNTTFQDINFENVEGTVAFYLASNLSSPLASSPFTITDGNVIGSVTGEDQANWVARITISNFDGDSKSYTMDYNFMMDTVTHSGYADADTYLSGLTGVVTDALLANSSLDLYASATSQGYTAVPEPTSGLLILLGMAGLALKRKRA